MTGCHRKKLVKEQITICIDSQAAVAAPGASGTKSLLVADCIECIEKLTALSEVNQVTIISVPGHSGIRQNEIADRLAKMGAMNKPIGPNPLLPLSLNRFKSEIRNWIGKRKQTTKWRVCERYGTSQSFLKGPADRYVQFISKLDRKHCRMLVELLTMHMNLHYMLYKMRRAKTPSCRRCGAEKETSVHILCECSPLEKIRMHTSSFARMDPDQIKEAKLSSIVVLGKEGGLLNSPL